MSKTSKNLVAGLALLGATALLSLLALVDWSSEAPNHAPGPTRILDVADDHSALETWSEHLAAGGEVRFLARSRIRADQPLEEEPPQRTLRGYGPLDPEAFDSVEGSILAGIHAKNRWLDELYANFDASNPEHLEQELNLWVNLAESRAILAQLRAGQYWTLDPGNQPENHAGDPVIYIGMAPRRSGGREVLTVFPVTLADHPDVQRTRRARADASRFLVAEECREFNKLGFDERKHWIDLWYAYPTLSREKQHEVHDDLLAKLPTGASIDPKRYTLYVK